MIIYKITNKVNGKVYIGQTTRSIEKRWKEHINHKSHCSALHSAIVRYGAEKFCVEVIDVAASIDELNTKEAYWIEKYKSIAPYGYNLDSGGKNKIICQFTRDKMSKSRKGVSKPHTGIPRSEKTKEKISLANKGHPYYPGVLTEDGRKRISQAQSISVSRYTKNGEYIDTFESATKAQQEIGVCSANITIVCKGRRKTAGGYVWRYANGTRTVSEGGRSGGEDNHEDTPRV